MYIYCIDIHNSKSRLMSTYGYRLFIGNQSGDFSEQNPVEQTAIWKVTLTFSKNLSMAATLFYGTDLSDKKTKSFKGGQPAIS